MDVEARNVAVEYRWAGACNESSQLAAELVQRGVKRDGGYEQPTKFELIVNTRTAKAIGINLSPSLLVRADEVVD